MTSLFDSEAPHFFIGKDMGSVVRVYKKGRQIGWQSRICRTGIATFTLSFCTYDEAVDWLNENEERYIDNPQSVIQEVDRIKELRSRRKKRSGRV